MKVAAAPPPPPPPRLPATPRADMPTGAFEALLRGDDQPRGFADLGMFGRRPEVVAVPDAGPRPEATLDPVAPASEVEAILAAATSPTAQAGTAQPPARLIQGLAAIVLAEAGRPSPAPTPGPIMLTVHANGPVEVFTHQAASPGEGAEATQAPPEPPAPDTQAPTGSSLSLIIADQADGLRVAIGGLSLPPSAQDRLRRKIIELASELGLALSEISLNGETLPPAFPLHLGDVDGDRGR
ncbi:hypothetical protein DDF62_22045 [Caulobacter radicis]|uniref:hypothetical protein n=1 Tax=Caulobacter radicis TaxID=2172650 RepID=UPI000D576534|nr:hypothetical protein [Caulobacter radicis]PVM84420.1 hypothetical protein DDF62_22045 [Caulobacter radicis]